jgi:hypothetical protein
VVSLLYFFRTRYCERFFLVKARFSAACLARRRWRAVAALNTVGNGSVGVEFTGFSTGGTSTTGRFILGFGSGSGAGSGSGSLACGETGSGSGSAPSVGSGALA